MHTCVCIFLHKIFISFVNVFDVEYGLDQYDLFYGMIPFEQ